MLDLKWLQSFIAVYEEGSFRAAANKLFISQPSITVHMKALEDYLQVQLFQRAHNKNRINRRKQSLLQNSYRTLTTN